MYKVLSCWRWKRSVKQFFLLVCLSCFHVFQIVVLDWANHLLNMPFHSSDFVFDVVCFNLAEKVILPSCALHPLFLFEVSRFIVDPLQPICFMSLSELRRCVQHLYMLLYLQARADGAAPPGAAGAEAHGDAMQAKL